MNVITIDLELNAPSRKIIQIGYTIHNAKTGKLAWKENLHVDPKEALSPAITELTGITQKDVDGAFTLLEAYKCMEAIMRSFNCTTNALAWGTDTIELRSQLGLTWAEYIFKLRYIDVKSMFQAYQMATPNGKTKVGLSKALNILGLEFIGRPHQAADDAENTFRVYRALAEKWLKADRVEKVLRTKE